MTATGQAAIVDSSRALDILCFGEPLIEFNEQPTRDDGQRPFLMGFGGDTSNAAVAAARQGARVGYLGALGADRFGRDIRAMWQREGICDRLVKETTGAPTGIYFVTHDANGHAFSYARAGSAAARVTAADIPEDIGQTTRILHVSAISQAISQSACDAVFAAITAARSQGCLISYDTNLRLSLWPLARARAILQETMRATDILLPSLDDSRILSGVDAPDHLADLYLGLGVGIVALKLGAEGALIATKDGRWRLPSLPVNAIDATGAGDAFAGAFLARLSAGDDPFRAGLYANIAAALSTTGYGAVAPIPHHKDVIRWLQEETTPT